MGQRQAGESDEVRAPGRDRRLGRPTPATRSLPLFVVLALGAAAASPLVSQSTSSSSTTKLITADQIAASHARTAWDALRLLVTNVQFRETRGRPARMSRRGRASLYLEDQLNVIIDGVRVYDLRLLEEMPASDILTIEVLTGLDATTYFGGGSTGGAIVIRTKTGESQ